MQVLCELQQKQFICMIWYIVLKEISDKHTKYKYGVHTYSKLLIGQLQFISTCTLCCITHLYNLQLWFYHVTQTYVDLCSIYMSLHDDDYWRNDNVPFKKDKTNTFPSCIQNVHNKIILIGITVFSKVKKKIQKPMQYLLNGNPGQECHHHQWRQVFPATQIPCKPKKTAQTHIPQNLTSSIFIHFPPMTNHSIKTGEWVSQKGLC